MEILILIILGVIQGLTEFLPISSSGHLVMLYEFFGINSDKVLLSILLHLATLLAVCVYYRKDILLLAKSPFCPTNRKIFVTTIFTVIIVLIFKPFIDATFSGQYLFVFFLITAMLLIVSEYMSSKNNLLSRTKNISTKNGLILEDITNININYKQAIIIGISQGIACIPGISRSGTTIATAKLIGVDNSACKYSFLISIPIIIASLIMEIISGASLGDVNIFGLISSMIICFFVGLLSIKIMTRLVENNNLSIFSYYLISLSTILILINMF